MPRRFSVVAAIGILMIAVGLVCWSFWPDTRRPRRDEVPNVDHVKLALQRSGPVALIDIPLKEAVEQLAREFDVKIEIDDAVISNADGFQSIDLDQPVTCQFEQVSLQTALSVILRDFGLSHFEKDGAILITTYSAYVDDYDNYVGVVYTLPPPSPHSRAFGPESLAEIVRWTVSADWWDVGGTGQIRVVPGGIVVIHLPHVHEQIRTIIERIDSWRDNPTRTEPIPLQPVAPISPQEIKIEKALNEVTSAEFIEVPIADVCEYFAGRHKIPVDIDVRAFEDFGIGTDTPITCQLSGITLRSALRLVLREIGLTYFVREDVLLITTWEEAEQQVTSTAYPVWDLVSPNCEVKKERLSDWMTSVVAPITWDTVGGPGTINWLSDDLLIVSQTDDVHDKIVDALSKLRRALDPLKPLDSFDAFWLTPPWRRDIAAAVERPWSKSVKDVPISDLPELVQDVLGIPVQLDEPALDDIGMSKKELVTFSAGGSALDSFRRTLRPIGLSVILRDEVLMITTVEEEESQLEISYVDVRDLIDPDFGLMDSSSLERLLIDVHSSTWDEVGGRGSVDSYDGILTIGQTLSIQFEVIELLRYLRANMSTLRNSQIGTISDMNPVGDDWRVFYLLHKTPPDESIATLRWLLKRFEQTAENHALSDLLRDRLRTSISSHAPAEETVDAINATIESTADAVRRVQLIDLLRYCGGEATGSLVKYLTEGSEGEQKTTVALLKRLGPKAIGAYPALLEHFKKRPTNRVFAAMHRISPEASCEVLPAAREMLNASPQVRKEAIEIMRRMGPAAADALPDLMMLINGDNYLFIANVIGRIDPGFPLTDKLLQEWLKSEDPKRRQQVDRITQWLNFGFGVSEAGPGVRPVQSLDEPFRDNPFRGNPFGENPEN